MDGGDFGVAGEILRVEGQDVRNPFRKHHGYQAGIVNAHPLHFVAVDQSLPMGKGRETLMDKPSVDSNLASSASAS